MNPCWSPDGQRIAFGRFDQASQYGSTWEITANGSDVRRLFPNWQETHLPAGWTPDGRLLLVSQGRLWTAPFRRFFQFATSPQVPISSAEPQFDSLVQLRDSRTLYAVGTTPRPAAAVRRPAEHAGSCISAGSPPIPSSIQGMDNVSRTPPTQNVNSAFAARTEASSLQFTKSSHGGMDSALVSRWPAPRLSGQTHARPALEHLPRRCGGRNSSSSVLQTDREPQGDFSWSPDGKTIVYAAPNERYPVATSDFGFSTSRPER